jgi:hypothetical protein
MMSILNSTLARRLPAAPASESKGLRLGLTAAAIGCLLAGSACSSVRLQSGTNPDSPVVTPIRSLVVVVVDERGEVRTAFENRFVRFLKARQVQAAPTYTHFALADLKLSQDEIRQKLKTGNAEAVLLTRLADRATSGGSANWSGGLLGPSTTMFDVDHFRQSVYGSGPEIHTTLLLESRLYRLDRGDLVWTAMTAVNVGESGDRLEQLTQVIGKVVDRMAKDRMIP